MADDVLDRLELPALVFTGLYVLTVGSKKDFPRVQVVVLESVVIDIEQVCLAPVYLLQVHATQYGLLLAAFIVASI